MATFLLASCAMPGYLPSYDKVDVNHYGSFIRIALNKKETVKGELLAIDRKGIVILPSDNLNNPLKPSVIPVSEIDHFRVYYARPKRYFWAIPLFSLATISHGYYSVFSLPVNAVVTSTIAVTGENAFTFSNKTMSIDKLSMYARYPQGIPAGITLDQIK